MNQENKNDLIRQKINEILNKEPDSKHAEIEAQRIFPGSAHQQFLRNLMNSGKGIEEIQVLWHEYYNSLDDISKRQVWNEFYESNTNLKFFNETKQKPLAVNDLKNQIPSVNKFKAKDKSTNKLNRKISDKVTANGKLNLKHQLQSLAFGLGIGLIVIVIFLFGFFNEYFITPFIQPSNNASNIPLIIGANDFVATSQNQVIIPKINVQIPTDYSIQTTEESTIENGLQNGVVHYPTTVLPGELGNTAFFGHSSNNIFNSGKYKFAFVLLHQLTKGDTFYLSYNQKMFIYKVIYTQIVSPSDVSVLDSVEGQTATATLITCDPPGTSLNRLVVVGQQISPNPSANIVSAVKANPSSATNLPGNGPSLFSKILKNSNGKIALIIFAVLLIGYIVSVFIRFKKLV